MPGLCGGAVMHLDLSHVAEVLPRHRVLSVDATPPYVTDPTVKRFWCRVCAVHLDGVELAASVQHIYVSGRDWPSIQCRDCGRLAWTPVVGSPRCERCARRSR